MSTPDDTTEQPIYNPNKDPFLELPKVKALHAEQQRYMAARRFELLARLKDRGRDKPTYPDDEDLMRWYNNCAENSLKQFHRGMEDLREMYRRGEI